MKRIIFLIALVITLFSCEIEGQIPGIGAMQKPVISADSSPVRWDITSYESVQTAYFRNDNISYAYLLWFSGDGTKFFYGSTSNDRVYSYSLSTAWDISTASYDNAYFSVSQDGTPFGLTFSEDGAKMFIAGSANDRIYSYSLSTSWDISTVSYDNVYFSVSGQTGSPFGVDFSVDGFKMYVSGTSNLYEYTLSTAWDISTASYVQNIGVTNSNPHVCFSNDGYTFWITELGNNRISQYDLSTAWDISTAAYNNFKYINGLGDASLYVYEFDNYAYAYSMNRYTYYIWQGIIYKQ
ncbi:YncE family protein [Draconibacterium mangrovi]|uniref:YncE family protein n=1 Tax=Draconibacterium mangrovi TaxID=2697469 RepID=UPI0013D6CED7|nr:hypothetical protein [Draconibacterium mangrovi]